MVYKGMVPLAGMLLFHFRESVSAPYVASLTAHQNEHPNQLLYQAALRDTWESGAPYFSFCRSQSGSGTYQFKRQWKAQPRPLRYLYPRIKNSGRVPLGGASPAVPHLPPGGNDLAPAALVLDPMAGEPVDPPIGYRLMKNQRSANVLIIIPAYQEEDNILRVLEDIRAHLPEPDILVINDGSTDRTAARARQAGVKVIDLPFNLGIGAAVQTGFQYAAAHRYTAAIQIDADYQHPAEEAPRLVKDPGG